LSPPLLLVRVSSRLFTSSGCSSGGRITGGVCGGDRLVRPAAHGTAPRAPRNHHRDRVLRWPCPSASSSCCRDLGRAGDVLFPPLLGERWGAPSPSSSRSTRPSLSSPPSMIRRDVRRAAVWGAVTPHRPLECRLIAFMGADLPAPGPRGEHLPGRTSRST